MKVRKLVEMYLRNSDLKGNSPRTAVGYRGRLRLFLEEFGERKLKSITLDELIEHFHRTSVGLSPTTQRQNIIQVEQVMKFAIDRDKLKDRWWKRGQIIKPKALGREAIPTIEQFTQMLSVMREDAKPIVRSLWLTGARPGELCAADVRNLEGPAAEMLIVLAQHKTARKTGMKREIILSPAAESIVVASIAERAEGSIFLTTTGRSWRVDRLSREFRRCRDHFGFSKQIVLYSLRHATASMMIDSGADISEVKVALGHTDIGTTQRYVHPDKRKVRRSVMRIADVNPLKAAG
jgi:site-specific recombinase XerD